METKDLGVGSASNWLCVWATSLAFLRLLFPHLQDEDKNLLFIHSSVMMMVTMTIPINENCHKKQQNRKCP